MTVCCVLVCDCNKSNRVQRHSRASLPLGSLASPRLRTTIVCSIASTSTSTGTSATAAAIRVSSSAAITEGARVDGSDALPRPLQP